jgi:hypothetical protein
MTALREMNASCRLTANDFEAARYVAALRADVQILPRVMLAPGRIANGELAGIRRPNAAMRDLTE